MLKVEVIYATLEAQELIDIVVEAGSDIETCINQSGILSQYPEIDLTQQKVGIFSQIKPLEHVVEAGDRVEIYRPLIADPKTVRREKAEAAKR